MIQVVEIIELCFVLLANYYIWIASRTRNLQWDYRCCHRSPVVRKSEVKVRCYESKPLRSANLIAHHGLMNVINQIIGLLCVLRDVEE